MADSRMIYVSIGNSDDKLSQSRWALYVHSVLEQVRGMAEVIHGEWYSAPDSPYQNVCVGFVLESRLVTSLQDKLAQIREHYAQDSLAWAEVAGTVMI